MATTTNNGNSCLLCGTKVIFGNDIILINSRKEICSKFVTQVSKYLNLKFPVESNESSGGGGPICCHICLYGVAEFCDTYKKLECVQLEMIRSAEGISKLLTSESASNYGFRNEFISGVETKRRQHCSDLTSSGDNDDDDQQHFTDSVVDTAGVDLDFGLDHDDQNPEDEEETEVKIELPEEGHQDEISDDGDGVSTDSPDVHFSNVDKNNRAAVTTGINGRLPLPKHCIFCGKKHRTGEGRFEHLRSHTREKSCVCRICLKEISSKLNLAQHIKFCHEEKVRNKCEICGKLVVKIKEHRRRKHESPTSPVKESVCDICGKAFLNQHNLARHQVVHLTERKFECDICHIRLKEPYAVTQHKRKIHGDDNRKAVTGETFSCRSCGTQFETKWRWVQHKREEHSGKESFKCPYADCEAVFDKHYELNKHFYAHIEERRFQCDQCGNAYVKRRSLEKHIKNVHALTNPAKCKYCDQTFTDKRELKSHQMTHSLFNCDICGKSFKNPSVLKGHKSQVHVSKDGPLVCEICGKELKNKFCLTNHRKSVHGDGKMYKCPHCKYTTYVKKNFTAHTKRKHQEKKIKK